MPTAVNENDQQTVRKRGGARPGAGRKRGSGNGLVSKIQVCVTPQQKTRYEKLGAAKWLRTFLNDEVITSRLVKKNVIENKPAPDKPMLVNAEGLQDLLAAPFIDRMPDGTTVTDTIDFNEYLLKDNPKHVIVPAATDDMRLAGVCQGDLLIINRMIVPEDGNLVLIQRKGEYVPRRFKYVKSRRIELHTEPAEGKSRVIELRKDSDFTMVGVVTGVVRKTR